MARDYTLKIKVDASELEKALKKALSSLHFNFGIGPGGASGSSSTAGVSEGFQKITKDINIYHHRNQAQLEQIHKNAMEYRTHSALLARENQMLRQYGGPFSAMLSAIGGRPGGALGKLLDLKMKSKIGLDAEGKPNIPQFVKIAGFAAGLAGAAGLGKLIIDSSPMLQAMLKLLNVGIMFMLRPIGDFLGFLLRPFIIMLIKFAIPFYRAFGGTNAQKLANKVLEGKFGEAGLDVLTMFRDLISPPKTEGEDGTILDERIKDRDIAIEGLKPVLGAIIDALTMGLPGLINKILQSASAELEKSQITKIYPWMTTGGGTGGGQSELSVYEQWLKAGAHGGKMGGEGSGLTTKITKGTSASDSLGMNDTIKATVKTSQDRINDLLKDGIKYADGTKIITEEMERLFSAMKNEDIVGMNDSMHGAQMEFKKIRQAGVLSSSTMTDMLNSILTAYKYFQTALNSAAALKLKSGKSSPVAKDAKVVGNALSYSAGLTGTLNTQNQPVAHGWRFTFPDGSIVEYPINTVTQRMIDAAKDQGARVIGFASGGILNEPVFGVGKSGQKYSFAERGPERISPVGSSGGSSGGNFNANFYISGVNNIDDFENKLKPMVLKWFKESQSKRGIL